MKNIDIPYIAMWLAICIVLGIIAISSPTLAAIALIVIVGIMASS